MTRTSFTVSPVVAKAMAEINAALDAEREKPIRVHGLTDAENKIIETLVNTPAMRKRIDDEMHAIARAMVTGESP